MIMIVKDLTYPQGEEHYNNELLSITNAGVKTTFGTVFLKKGTRIPDRAFSRHPFNEVSVIIDGCIEMLNEDGSVSCYLEKGKAVFINAFEPQAGNVLEDTKLIYVINQNA